MQLTTHYKPTRKKGTNAKYPWEAWFKTIREKTVIAEGRGLRLKHGNMKQGADFDCDITAMVNRIRKQAKRAEIQLTIYCEPDGLVIFHRPDSPAAHHNPASRDQRSHHNDRLPANNRSGKHDVPLRGLSKANSSRSTTPRHPRASRATSPENGGRCPPRSQLRAAS